MSSQNAWRNVVCLVLLSRSSLLSERLRCRVSIVNDIRCCNNLCVLREGVLLLRSEFETLAIRIAGVTSNRRVGSPSQAQPHAVEAGGVGVIMLASDEGMRCVAQGKVGVDLLDVWVGEGG